MQIGWIDYSKRERNQVLTILRLLETQTALDELGIGSVRDAFSDLLFPGISTQQTRAKYFVLIPYLFAQAERQHFKGKRDVLKYVHDQEENLVKTLVANSGSGADGIIGSRNFKQGRTVKMKPSSIYWSGLRTTSILRYPNLSIDDACEVVMANGQRRSQVTLKTEGTDDAADDVDALSGGPVMFSPIVPDYVLMKDAEISLTRKEAQYLKDHFISSPGTAASLIAFMLKENVQYSSFYEIDESNLPSALGRTVALAQEFGSFIYGAHLLYNIIYAEGCQIHNEQTEALLRAFEDWREDYIPVRLDDVIATTRCAASTAQFLRAFDNSIQKDDITAAKELIVHRERIVKPNRSKLRNPEQYRYERPIHDYLLDYRFGTASTIISDIIHGLEGT